MYKNLSNFKKFTIVERENDAFENRFRISGTLCIDPVSLAFIIQNRPSKDQKSDGIRKGKKEQVK
jgi:hypothetical protein